MSIPSFRARPAPTALAALALVLLAAPAHAQRESQEWLEECRERESRGREVHCEVREMRLPATGRFEVDAAPNGGITVEGWDRDEVLVTARVRAQAPDIEEARAMASEIEVVAEPGRVRSEGPRARGNNRGWSVSYVVMVPRRTDLRAGSTNGGIRVADVTGQLELQTTNGGVALERVAGDVRGRTVNGSLKATLDGRRWEGAGLDLKATNGAITLLIPDDYNASLEASTVNGGMNADFPIRVQGRIGRRLETELGQGGAPIRLATTNGGIRLQRR